MDSGSIGKDRLVGTGLGDSYGTRELDGRVKRCDNADSLHDAHISSYYYMNGKKANSGSSEIHLDAESAFSFKAVAIGSLGSLCIALGAPYGNMVIRGSYMSIDFSTAGALFIFFALTGLINALLTRFIAPLALGRRELIVAYIMMIVASAIPTMGLSEYLLTIITGAQYFATPENEWGSLILPHPPEWMVPQSPEAIKWFFEGAPRGMGVP